MKKPELIDLMFLDDASELTNEQIRYFRDNPEMINLVSDRETLGLRNLWRVLGIAAILVALSKVISISYGDEFDRFFLNVVSDLVFEMGAALIGSIATVIFIKYQQKRQFEDNMKFRAEIDRRIELMESKGAE